MKELASAHAREAKNREMWFQVFQDVQAECEKRIAQEAKRLAAMEERALKAERKAEKLQDKLSEKLHEKEKDVFLEPACAHNIWSYYAGETSQRILAYAVEVMGIEDKKAVGNLYPLAYRKHVESVKDAAIPADRIRMVYEKGERFENRNKSLSKKDDAVLGRYRYSEYVPNDRRAWEAALYQEERKREMMRCGKIEEHIRKLAG